MIANEFVGDVISILVIEKGIGLSARIVECLRESHTASRPGYRLLLHTAHSLSELEAMAPEVRVDFVVIAMDMTETTYVEYARSVLSELPARLLMRRTVLVNALGVQYGEARSHLDSLKELERQFCVDTMSGDVRDAKICRFLVNRLIIYMEDSVGFHSGVPNIYSTTHKGIRVGHDNTRTSLQMEESS